MINTCSGRCSSPAGSKTESTILNHSAHQKFFTENPSISRSASMMMLALITSKKRPRVKTVMGMVNRMSRGFTTELRKASTAATRIAMNTLSLRTSTPEPSSQAVMITARVEIMSLMMKFMVVNLQKPYLFFKNIFHALRALPKPRLHVF
jgi:hypothetical protein